MPPRLARAAALFALALVALHPAPAASAQQAEACLPPGLTLQKGPSAWEPGSRFVLQFAVDNPNEPPVESVTARLFTTAPQGWTASLAETALTLTPGASRIDPLTVTAPRRGTGVASGEIAISVQVTCHRAGGVDARSLATTSFDVQLTAIRVPWLLVGALVLATLAATAVVWVVRRSQPGVVVASSASEKPLAPGKGTHFPLLVGNRRREPDAIALSLADVPAGWTAHVAVPELELEGREEREIWLSVRAPAEARPGDEATIRVRAVSRRRPRDVASVDVRARVG